MRFHPRILEPAAHYRFAPKPCQVGLGNEKGRVERAISGRIQIRLLNLLRSMGKTEQFKKLEEEIRRRWAVADADHPARLALERSGVGGE